MNSIRFDKKVFYCLFFLLMVLCKVGAQNKPITYSSTFMRWEASVSSGLFADLFYANISFNGNRGAPLDYNGPIYYSNIPGKRVRFGKVDRLEAKYYFNKKSALSLNFSYALWKDIYGNGNDPLESWTETRKYTKRMQYAANYYRNFYSKNERSSYNVGLGLLIQAEQNSFPFYLMAHNDPSAIMVMDASDRYYFWDWATQLTASYYYSVNPNLKLGLTFQTLYVMNIGLESAGLLGSVAIPFRSIKKIKHILAPQR